jgi:hypothetical protein
MMKMCACDEEGFFAFLGKNMQKCVGLFIKAKFVESGLLLAFTVSKYGYTGT